MEQPYRTSGQPLGGFQPVSGISINCDGGTKRPYFEPRNIDRSELAGVVEHASEVDYGAGETFK